MVNFNRNAKDWFHVYGTGCTLVRGMEDTRNFPLDNVWIKSLFSEVLTGHCLRKCVKIDLVFLVYVILVSSTNASHSYFLDLVEMAGLISTCCEVKTEDKNSYKSFVANGTLRMLCRAVSCDSKKPGPLRVFMDAEVPANTSLDMFCRWVKKGNTETYLVWNHQVSSLEEADRVMLKEWSNHETKIESVVGADAFHERILEQSDLHLQLTTKEQRNHLSKLSSIFRVKKGQYNLKKMEEAFSAERLAGWKNGLTVADAIRRAEVITEE